MTDAQQYELSPAYDVLPSGQALGFQQLRVGKQDADSTLDNALSMAPMFSLDRDEAVREVRAVVRVVDMWQVHFKACGVSRGDLDSYAEQLGRPFLLEQRAQFRRLEALQLDLPHMAKIPPDVSHRCPPIAQPRIRTSQ